MFYITIPNLLTTVAVLLILNSGWILNSNFDFYWIFTNPTNWERMEVLDMYIYKFGLRQLNFSYATAIGMIKSLVSILLILGVNTVSRRTTDRAIF
jgi:putative aldouronate transport system permease protein